jgi:pSer/pThr/pTyr-binding forkhead associated (FHA) protein/6-phosphogluconolactonase (cycloisomerase 2 family)
MPERLKVVKGFDPGAEIEVPESGIVFGRDEEGIGKLGDDPRLSRRHARIVRNSDGQLLLEDLGSSNGSFVNDDRVRDYRLLQPGDRIRLGITTLELMGVREDRTMVGSETVVSVSPPPPPPAPRVTPSPHPATAQMPVAAAAVPQAPQAAPQLFTPPQNQRRSRGGGGALALALLGILIGLGAATAFWLVKGTGSSNASGDGGGGRLTVTQNVLSVPEAGTGGTALTAYVETNVAAPGANAIMAIRFRDGDLQATRVAQYPTGGSGSADLTDSGVLDADQQVIVNAQHSLLFAVNQGSDTIAVFRIQGNGDLQPVPGSPFDSHGKAPASLGLSGNVLVVANKSQDGIRDLSAEKPNYVTFTVADDGTLSYTGQSIDAEPGSSPTQAFVPPSGGLAMSTEESGPIKMFTVGKDGQLALGKGSPLDPEPKAFTAGFQDEKKFGLGIGAHPTQRLIYMNYPTVPSLAVYTYAADGSLTFVRSVYNGGSYLPCWIQVTKDGRWLFTANADTDNMSAFDLSDPQNPRQIQTFGLKGAGNPWNEALDPTDRYLLVITPRDTTKVPAGEGNTIHVLKVGSDGKLSEVDTSPTKLPVPDSANPQGLAVIAPGS